MQFQRTSIHHPKELIQTEHLLVWLERVCGAQYVGSSDVSMGVGALCVVGAPNVYEIV